MRRLQVSRTFHLVFKRNFASRSLLPTIDNQVFKLKPITPNDSCLSCTVFNSKGAVTDVSKKFPKLPFLRDHGLYPRDLRKLDSSTIDVIPSIIIKPSCMLVNFLHVKAMIKKDKVYVFDTANKDAATKLGVFMYDLESKLSTRNSVPSIVSSQYYEHIVLESILINVMTCLDTEFNNHSSLCGKILSQLEDEINRDKLRDLLIKSKELTAFYQKSLLIRDVLDELLDSDEDLTAMYLTDVRSEENNDFSDVEMLLETYYKQCDEYVQQSGTLLQDIKSTEEVVNIILDANRNAMMLFELKVTIYTLGFTVATLLPAFYGMNLKNYIEESIWGFIGVLALSIVSALAVTASNFRALRSVTRLTMLNNHTGSHTAKHISNAKIQVDRVVPGLLGRWNSSLRDVLFGKSRIPRNGKQRDMIWKWLLDENKK
ncbi:HEL062Wp [Eremothecium sinecaudum]|uniref:Magnesium transporter n=1 Tax=Eremothecium sinecaudum TaxID=45286 RepID=A0A0X8HTN6_9SACH|nr:HEL062Wp [Eremothecium sinecaudum]AMD21218.1 HEL062Wp [Eremothecium sinecaudum]